MLMGGLLRVRQLRQAEVDVPSAEIPFSQPLSALWVLVVHLLQGHQALHQPPADCDAQQHPGDDGPSSVGPGIASVQLVV